MNNQEIENEARRLIRRYGQDAARRADVFAEVARSDADQRYWEAVEQQVLEMMEQS